MRAGAAAAENPWYTVVGRPEQIPSSELSPSLLYHKWHAYDADSELKLATDGSRVDFLRRVAGAVENARASAYAQWYRSYEAAVNGLGAEPAEWLSATTVWRFVAGFATNPALESGLHLHHLLGFPHLPGSSVRGLVHHVAEMELLDDPEREAWPEQTEPPDSAALDRFLDAAAQVRAIFGSLVVEPIDAQQSQAAASTERRETPRSLLKCWLGSGALRDGSRQSQAARARVLLAGQTGGLAAFYDAVPDPGAADLLEVDILNPHYPRFYRSQGRDAPPSDDQDPGPVHFLAVRPDARFLFPLRLAEWPDRSNADQAGKERLGALGSLTRGQAADNLRRWLLRGLDEWGAGAKTAAGYGYFATGGEEPEARVAAQSIPATGSGPAVRTVVPTSQSWAARLKGIGWGEADAQVPVLLAELQGADRRQAALELVKRFGRRKLLTRAEKPWTRDLLDAAGLL
jgi:CRISPR type III-B/RAMP module RAMP protein Cmr6